MCLLICFGCNRSLRETILSGAVVIMRRVRRFLLQRIHSLAVCAQNQPASFLARCFFRGPGWIPYMAAAAGGGGGWKDWGDSGGGGGGDKSWKGGGGWHDGKDWHGGDDPTGGGNDEIDSRWYNDCRWCKKCNKKTYLTTLSIP